VIVISTGCPAGVGPEVSVAAAARSREPCVLVGDLGTLLDAARLVGVPEKKLAPFTGRAERGKVHVYHVGPALSARERSGPRGGAAQLLYIDAAYDLVKAGRGRALVTAPVSKHAIARSGVRRARAFRGHTEWLGRRDGARRTVMCFVAPGFATSLVTTHLPLAEVARAIDRAGVTAAIDALAELLARLGKRAPRIAVCSLNPHAGEGELFGTEERTAIVPGMREASRRARLTGPIGAETAFRKAHAGELDGVVAMYHDQATIPLKLVAFGSAVNVTMGLSIVRTSVDHGTAYDIAWKGRADASAMRSAIALAAEISR
jgi:4-hydroxythreonine-4-phosphate dehydrogenase